jgi:hypothetical protein
MSLINIDQSKLAAKKAAEAEANRKAAYIAEADPLFFKWQAGETTEAEWKAKRYEIKSRFPKEV